MMPPPSNGGTLLAKAGHCCTTGLRRDARGQELRARHVEPARHGDLGGSQVRRQPRQEELSNVQALIAAAKGLSSPARDVSDVLCLE